jgi:2-haloacid dehalogenase
VRPEPSAGGAALTTVVFDLGGVVLGWAPERAFEGVMPAAQVPAFLAAIDFANWNRRHDAGLPFATGEAELIQRLPEAEAAIRAYRQHFDRTLTGMIPGTGAVVAELEQAGVRLLALTNWSAETFPRALERFGLLQRFEGIVVSGAERLAKPDPALFEVLFARYDLDPHRTVFIDDSLANVTTATGLGLTALPFADAEQLRRELVGLGLLGPRPPVTQPLFHLTERALWQADSAAGEFSWSSRNLTYDRQGFVHCSYADQVRPVASQIYADVDPAELVVLEIDLRGVLAPVVVEEGEPGVWFPHLYAPLPLDRVTSVHELQSFLAP